MSDAESIEFDILEPEPEPATPPRRRRSRGRLAQLVRALRRAGVREVTLRFNSI